MRLALLVYTGSNGIIYSSNAITGSAQLMILTNLYVVKQISSIKLTATLNTYFLLCLIFKMLFLIADKCQQCQCGDKCKCCVSSCGGNNS